MIIIYLEGALVSLLISIAIIAIGKSKGIEVKDVWHTFFLLSLLSWFTVTLLFLFSIYLIILGEKSE